MSERVARRRAETRRRIVDVAMRLFVERGYDNVTVADITEAADVAKGTFFTHFPSKSDIFRYVGGEAVDAMAAAATGEGTARERITAALDAAARWHVEHQDLGRQMLLVRSFNFAKDLGSDNQRRFSGIVMDLLAEGVASGEFRSDLAVADAALLIQGTYYLSVITWLSTPEDRPLNDRMDAALDVLFRGIQ